MADQTTTMTPKDLAALLLQASATKAQVGGAVILMADMLPRLLRLWQNLKGGPGEVTQLGHIFDKAEAAGQAHGVTGRCTA
jgi:hypothetical protein